MSTNPLLHDTTSPRNENVFPFLSFLNLWQNNNLPLQHIDYKTCIIIIFFAYAKHILDLMLYTQIYSFLFSALTKQILQLNIQVTLYNKV